MGGPATLELPRRAGSRARHIGPPSPRLLPSTTRASQTRSELSFILIQNHSLSLFSHPSFSFPPFFSKSASHCCPWPLALPPYIFSFFVASATLRSQTTSFAPPTLGTPVKAKVAERRGRANFRPCRRPTVPIMPMLEHRLSTMSPAKLEAIPVRTLHRKHLFASLKLEIIFSRLVFF